MAYHSPTGSPDVAVIGQVEPRGLFTVNMSRRVFSQICFRSVKVSAQRATTLGGDLIYRVIYEVYGQLT